MRTVMALALSGLRHRPGRAVLTALAVTLGAAVMAALLAVVASVEREIAPLNAGVQAGADWIVGVRTGSLPPELIREVASLPEVVWVAPRSQTTVLVDMSGEITRAMLFAVDPAAETGSGLLRVETGLMPGPGAPGVAMRTDAARSLGLAPGDPVAFYAPDGRRMEWPLTGMTGREGVGGAGGFLGLIIHLDRAPDVGLPAGPSRLLVGLREHGTADWARARSDILSRYGASAWAAPPPHEGKTGGAVMLLIFSALGPVLSSFLIQNAFAISLRQRVQELALWRTLGATNRQVMAALLAEGALLGLAGGAAGLGTGFGVGRLVLGHIMGFSSLQADQSLGAVRLSLPPWMALLSLGVASAVTVAAAVQPALAARRLGCGGARQGANWPEPPVTALLAPLSALVSVISRRRLPLYGPYGAAATIGLRRMGESSRRAAAGARTLAVVTVLLIGFGSISAAAWQATAGALTADRADLLVQGGITPSVVAELQKTAGVASVQLLSRFEATVGQEGAVTAWATEAVAGGQVLVGSKLARKQGLRIGDTLEVSSAAYRVAAIVPEDWDGPSTFYLSPADAVQHAVLVPVKAKVTLSKGALPEQVAQDLRKRLAGLKVQTFDQIWQAARQAHREKLGTFMAILYLLAGFGALGVIQTSVLTVYEQLPELALLRAAGATVRQTVLVVLVQAALPGVAGGVFGAAGGVLLGYKLVQLFAQWRGADLAGVGGVGWVAVPVLVILTLSVVSSLPALVAASRLSVAGVLQRR